ncbi:mannosyltransferase OCH1-like enzyme [Beggiatoa alba B18LD]|uniref:Mannosyltransferase OCH1-like enzyme n=1 Tax=Beggiatoa alba B18LD TaxID=395493 RepID=I3CEA5_9GAMM|nr:glycosyltransferase [Beggiatoa alba]EIJ41948.1 mannosyltransferase OCH1-like enzyme [Beggiatoa alba B18LD]
MMRTNIIPKNILQFWHDKQTFPAIYQQARQQNQEKHPDFTFYYLDDAEIERILQKKFHPCLLELYRANRIPASRSDIARLITLYEYGGFYLDMSFVLHRPLTTLIDTNSQIYLVKRDDMPRYQDCPHAAHIYNGFLGAVPHSPFIYACLLTIINNLLAGHYNQNVLEATGPFAINQVFQKTDKKRINVLSLKALKENFLTHLNIQGVRQSWVSLQEQGIIDTQQLSELQRKYPPMTALHSPSWLTRLLKQIPYR